MLTNVESLVYDVNVHSTSVRPLYPSHSMTSRLLGSITFAVADVDTSYISHSHLTGFPTSSLPLLFVNQNLVVISGLTNASKTSATGLRISIAVFATGSCVSWRLFMDFKVLRVSPRCKRS